VYEPIRREFAGQSFCANWLQPCSTVTLEPVIHCIWMRGEDASLQPCTPDYRATWFQWSKGKTGPDFFCGGNVCHCRLDLILNDCDDRRWERSPFLDDEFICWQPWLRRRSCRSASPRKEPQYGLKRRSPYVGPAGIFATISSCSSARSRVRPRQKS
jgi:hypothetical protein